MSAKARIVVVDRMPGDDFPIPDFEHTWSEFPHTSADDLIPRVFWATILITHDCALSADTLNQLHKLTHIVITGAADVDRAACSARGITVVTLDSPTPRQVIDTLGGFLGSGPVTVAG